MRTNIAVLFLCLFAAGCHSVPKRELSPAENTVTERGAVACWGEWIKDKGEKFDIGFGIRNESKDSIIIFLHDIVAGRGDAEGPVKHAIFGIGEKTIDFVPGQTKTLTLVCESVDAKPGPYHVTIRKVYTNPNRDGRTYGDVIADDVKWKSE